MASLEKLRIGTRGSPLALHQTRSIVDLLRQHYTYLQDSSAIETVIIKTTGDREQSRLLAEIGGKGLFTKELDEAMLRDEIDLAIHSMKDMPTVMPEGIVLHAITERKDPRDAFISLIADNIKSLPNGCKVGTSSIRRKSQLLNLRPDLKVVPLRGNVDTRLRKISEGEVDATFLAYAGLSRLGKESEIRSLIDVDEMLPAVGQGVLAATCREGDLRANNLLSVLAHPNTTAAVMAERAMLRVLDGSCHTPIAGMAEVDETGDLFLRGSILQPDGARKAEVSLKGRFDDPEQLGINVAEKLILKSDPEMFAEIKRSQLPLIEPHPETEYKQDIVEGEIGMSSE